MTPLPLAQALAAALQPSGVILEPTAGTGNFVRALEPYGDVRWCEIDRGRDFFDWTEPVDEIVTNPPWSLFAKVLAPTGFQLAMVVLTRGFKGPCTMETLDRAEPSVPTQSGICR